MLPLTATVREECRFNGRQHHYLWLIYRRFIHAALVLEEETSRLRATIYAKMSARCRQPLIDRHGAAPDVPRDVFHLPTGVKQPKAFLLPISQAIEFGFPHIKMV